MSDAKARLRAWAKEERSRIDFSRASRLVASHLRSWELLAGTVLTYAALADEVDLSGLRHACPDIEWVVTRTPQTGTLTAHPASAPMERHRFGFRQPVADAPVVAATAIDVALVPGLVFDDHGSRLGRGMAHFDRFLATLAPNCLRVGITPAALVVATVPSEAHDVAMTHLATEDGVVAVGGAK